MNRHIFSLLAALSISVSSFVGLSPRGVSAHWHVFMETAQPTFEAPYVIDDVLIQRGFYGSLVVPGQVDFFQINVAQYSTFSTWLTVPQTPQCVNFRPKLALIAPGEALPDAANYPAPAGMISQVYGSPLWGRYVDPDTRLGYFAGPRVFPALEAGSYYLAVFDDSGAMGNYLLLVGDHDTLGGDPDWLAKATARHDCPQGLG